MSDTPHKVMKYIVLFMIFLAFVALVLMDVRGVMTGGPGVQDAATVNGERITTRDLSMRVDDMARRMGIPQGDAAKAGIPQYVLQGMISDKLAGQGIDTLGLRFSDKVVAQELKAMLSDPKDNSAEAMKQRYDMARRQSGLSARAFEDEIRAGIARRYVMEALKAGQTPDPLMANVLAKRSAERRDIAVITLSTDPSAIKETPDEGEIEALYTEHQKEFTVPETRSGRVFTLPAKQLEEKGSEDPQAYVMEIEDAFAGGDTLENVVKTYGLTEGDAVKDAARDPSQPQVDALFSLDDVGQVSNALELSDGTGFVVLDAVTPEKTKPLDDVKDQIVSAWKHQEALDRARAQEAELRAAKDPVEFARKKGLPLEIETGQTVKNEALAPAFDAPLNRMVELQPNEKALRMAVVTKVTPGASTLVAKEASVADWQAAQGGDAMSYFYQMLVAWTDNVKVKVNEKALAALAQPAATPVQ